MLYYVANTISRSIECQDFNNEKDAFDYIKTLPRSIQHEFSVMASFLYVIESDRKIAELQGKLRNQELDFIKRIEDMDFRLDQRAKQVSRRNLQIADLKKKLAKANEIVLDTTDEI